MLVVGVTMWMLYNVAFEEERHRLVEAAQSQARLIEAIARHEQIHGSDDPGGWQGATLKQVHEAHLEYRGFGETGEFTLARREGDLIVFLLTHRHEQIEHPEPVPMDSDLAEPMRRALQGKSGTVVGLDYRGETVLAAHEPVAVIDLGIVAKVNLAEVRAPFLRAAIATAGFTALVVMAGSLLFIRVTNPLVEALARRTQDLEQSVSALQASEARFRSTFELAGAGIVQCTPAGRFTRFNQRFCDITGFSREELDGLGFADITHPEEVELDLVETRRILGGEIETYSAERRYLRRDDSIVWVSLVVSLVRDQDGSPDHLICVLEDITERKRAQLEVRSALREKEVLLREIHHRVKNNMQVISSLLTLQSSRIDDPQLLKVFQDSQNRVRAMALIHEILYESGNIGRIDLERYVSKLATSLVQMYGTEPGSIELEVRAHGVTLELDDTVPCGLVLNELLSNSLKYAFPNGRGGSIKIEAMRSPDGRIELLVCDDGSGVPPEVDIRNTETMGMRLVVGLVETQLGGDIVLDRSRGSCFTIRFRPSPGQVGVS